MDMFEIFQIGTFQRPLIFKFQKSAITFSSHTEYVKRESIVIAWVKKNKIPSFWRMFMICMY